MSEAKKNFDVAKFIKAVTGYNSKIINLGQVKMCRGFYTCPYPNEHLREVLYPEQYLAVDVVLIDRSNRYIPYIPPYSATIPIPSGFSNENTYYIYVVPKFTLEQKDDDKKNNELTNAIHLSVHFGVPSSEVIIYPPSRKPINPDDLNAGGFVTPVIPYSIESVFNFATFIKNNISVKSNNSANDGDEYTYFNSSLICLALYPIIMSIIDTVRVGDNFVTSLKNSLLGDFSVNNNTGNISSYNNIYENIYNNLKNLSLKSNSKNMPYSFIALFAFFDVIFSRTKCAISLLSQSKIDFNPINFSSTSYFDFYKYLLSLSFILGFNSPLFCRRGVDFLGSKSISNIFSLGNDIKLPSKSADWASSKEDFLRLISPVFNYKHAAIISSNLKLLGLSFLNDLNTFISCFNFNKINRSYDTAKLDKLLNILASLLYYSGCIIFYEYNPSTASGSSYAQKCENFIKNIYGSFNNIFSNTDVSSFRGSFYVFSTPDSIGEVFNAIKNLFYELMEKLNTIKRNKDRPIYYFYLPSNTNNLIIKGNNNINLTPSHHITSTYNGIYNDYFDDKPCKILYKSFNLANNIFLFLLKRLSLIAKLEKTIYSYNNSVENLYDISLPFGQIVYNFFDMAVLYNNTNIGTISNSIGIIPAPFEDKSSKNSSSLTGITSDNIRISIFYNSLSTGVHNGYYSYHYSFSAIDVNAILLHFKNVSPFVTYIPRYGKQTAEIRLFDKILYLFRPSFIDKSGNNVIMINASAREIYDNYSYVNSPDEYAFPTLTYLYNLFSIITQELISNDYLLNFLKSEKSSSDIDTNVKKRIIEKLGNDNIVRHINSEYYRYLLNVNNYYGMSSSGTSKSSVIDFMINNKVLIIPLSPVDVYTTISNTNFMNSIFAKNNYGATYIGHYSNLNEKYISIFMDIYRKWYTFAPLILLESAFEIASIYGGLNLFYTNVCSMRNYELYNTTIGVNGDRKLDIEPITISINNGGKNMDMFYYHHKVNFPFIDMLCYCSILDKNKDGIYGIYNFMKPKFDTPNSTFFSKLVSIVDSVKQSIIDFFAKGSFEERMTTLIFNNYYKNVHDRNININSLESIIYNSKDLSSETKKFLLNRILTMKLAIFCPVFFEFTDYSFSSMFNLSISSDNSHNNHLHVNIKPTINIINEGFISSSSSDKSNIFSYLFNN